jgi:hypothetical protein
MTTTGTRTFALAFACIFVAMFAWSLAMPLPSGPDEPTHVERAVALERGQLLGMLLSPTSPTAEVHIPGFYSVDRAIPDCYHRKAIQPASCAPPLSVTCPPRAANSTVPACGVAFIYDARYPPAYYAVVGLGSALGERRVAIYAMRLLSAAMAAALIALGVTAVLRYARRRTVLIGLLVGATPMAVYLGGIVNESGFEIAAAICFWTSGSVLVLDRLEDPPGRLIAIAAGSACVFALARAISPFWLILALIALIAVADWGPLWRLRRSRPLRVGTTALLVCGIAAVIWTVKEHALLVTSAGGVPATVSTLTILGHSFAHTAFYIPGMVGVFGDFDTYSPLFTFVVWYSLVVGLVVLAVVRCGLRRALVLIGLCAAVIVLPVLISSSQARLYGYTWSGRDALPLAVGVPILAAALIARSHLVPPRWVIAGLITIAGLAQFVAFYEALRRYAVGTAGPVFGFLTHPDWAPPVGIIGGLLIEIVGLVACGVALWHSLETPPVAPRAPSELAEMPLDVRV